MKHYWANTYYYSGTHSPLSDKLYNIGDRFNRWARGFFGVDLTLASDLADSVNTIRDSPPLKLLSSYWNGSSAVDYSASIYHRMLSTTPTSELVFQIANVDQLSITDDGKLDFKNQALEATAGTLAGYIRLKVGGVEYKIPLYNVV